MTRTHGETHWDPDNCFGCKVTTVDFGYPYGRQFFHNSTIKERVRKENEEVAWAAKHQNDHFEPKPCRAVLV
jgi:hypothetical protein